MFVKPMSSYECPVCGASTSDVICPYSISGSFKGKGRPEHRTYDKLYSTERSNPYWDTVDGVEGFRLRWTQTELSSILTEVSSLTGHTVILSSSYVSPAEWPERIFFTPEHTWGLTRDEVFALLCIELYKGIEFPKDSKTVDKCLKLFAVNKIPSGLQELTLETLAYLRNIHSLMTSGFGDSNYRSFRNGLMRLLFRYIIPWEYTEFLADDRRLDISPMIEPLPPIDDFPNIFLLDDDARRMEYSKLESRHSFDRLFSHLYYHMLINENNSYRCRKLFCDIKWLMSEYDRHDVFGFPGFIYLPEDRLVRILFLFAIASLRYDRNDRSILFLTQNQVLSSTISPYSKPTTDIIDSNNGRLWVRRYMYRNVEIHDGYLSAVLRLGSLWLMNIDTETELYARICGYTGNADIESSITGDVLHWQDISSLQAGITHDGKPAELLNFKYVMTLLSQFINNPSPLPFRLRPRYGIMRCGSCNHVGYVDDFKFGRGCFDHIDENTGTPIPVSAGSELYNIVISYKCPKCSASGCRELIVRLVSSVEIHKDGGVYSGKRNVSDNGNIVDYKFEPKGIKYKIKGRVTEVIQDKDVTYDNEIGLVLFDDKKGEISTLGRNGPNGEPIFIIRSTDNRSILKLLELPVTLSKNLSTADADKNVACPYELEEINESNVDPCCQKMPSEMTPNPSQTRLNRRSGGGTHTVRLMTTSRLENGVIVERYECLDHKARIMKMIDNLGNDPALNDSPLKRGSAEISQIYIRDKPVDINDDGARLSNERIESTGELSMIPLSFQDVPEIAPASELFKSMRYPRVVSEPDVPIYEDGAPPPGMHSIRYRPDNRLAVEVRHFYTFDIKRQDPALPDAVDCAEICRDWEELNMIRATMPFERTRKKYKVTLKEKQIRRWQISHSPSKLVPHLSVPFIPTVTPKRRTLRRYGLTKVKKESSLVCVHVDVSGSMTSPEFNMSCPYLTTPDECERCGDFMWSDDIGCYKQMNGSDVAIRLLVSSVMNAREISSYMIVYGFGVHNHDLNPPDYIDDNDRELPCNDYQLLIDWFVNNETIQSAPGNGTHPETSMKKMLNDLQEQEIDRAVLIMLTDGDFHGEYGPTFVKALKTIGPLFLFVIGDSDIETRYKNMTEKLESAGWDPEKDHPFVVIPVDTSDGGVSLSREAGSIIQRTLKKV